MQRSSLATLGWLGYLLQQGNGNQNFVHQDKSWEHGKSKQGSQKQNRRKAKKRKGLGETENMEKVRRYISDTAPSHAIDTHNLHYEALGSLSTC